ncbi:hypothetical protein B0H12DRAFT_156758 [Mycena haematopus]|nr:hypothetical protein B0H12DRAFT_156758 [Mycena haematopus]
MVATLACRMSPLRIHGLSAAPLRPVSTPARSPRPPLSALRPPSDLTTSALPTALASSACAAHRRRRREWQIRVGVWWTTAWPLELAVGLDKPDLKLFSAALPRLHFTSSLPPSVTPPSSPPSRMYVDFTFLVYVFRDLRSPTPAVPNALATRPDTGLNYLRVNLALNPYVPRHSTSRCSAARMRRGVAQQPR